MSEVTRILSELQQGDPRATEQLLPLVYDELRKLAARRLADEAPGQTLQATGLVHEAYLRLVGGQRDAVAWNGKGHFFGAAAEAMRRILIENARSKRAAKREGSLRRVDLADMDLAETAPPEHLLALDEALTRLAAEAPRKADLVKLRFFAGLSIDEAARAMEISPATAKRWWTFSRAWLLNEIQHEEPSGVQPSPES